jgi:hypothetical protein
VPDHPQPRWGEFHFCCRRSGRPTPRPIGSNKQEAEKIVITKERWAEIEKDLRNLLARARFKLGEDEITATRRLVKEGRYEIVVYFNGEIKGAWSPDPEDKNYQPLIEKFWRKRSRSLYSSAEKAKAIKGLGKRRAEKFIREYGLDKKYVFYTPFWPKAKALINHLKKIEGLEFMEGDSVRL